MTWLPDFKIGLCNAWLFMLFLPLHPLFMIIIDKAFGSGDIFKKMGDVPVNDKEKWLNLADTLFQIMLLIVSIFLPLRVGTAWFYTGLTISIIGFVIFLISLINVATTPSGQLFTNGVYRFSRHPLYLSTSLIPLGAGIASASWIFMILAVVNWVFFASQVKNEEEDCLQAFGEEYQKYLAKTPRWLGIPKIK
jgi:protein-S-isoprenylcysteine O-methyltransferase Ste14